MVSANPGFRMLPKLGIIAGGGVLPFQLMEAARSAGRDFFILGLKDHADASLPVHHWVRLGALGEAIDKLKNAGCRELVLGGQVRRPSLLELMPDWRGAKFFARSGAALLGDDGLLKAVRGELEGEGFTLLGPQEVLASLLTPAGLLTQRAPDDDEQKDINRAVAALMALAPHDVGQAAVVQQGLVLGLEAIEGTAELIKRTAAYRRAGRGGVLVKLSKPQQDKQLDVPAIGPDTIAQCKAASLVGIALQAGASLLLEREKTLAAADAAGLFLLGLELKS
jgi:UDP-2,3-diacylglucosamine hydrolase